MWKLLSEDVQYDKLESLKNVTSNDSSTSDTIHIPKPAENRRPTNEKFLIVFIIAVVVLMAFSIYTMVNGQYGWLTDQGNSDNICCEKYSNICCKQTISESFEWLCTGGDFADGTNLQCDSSISEVDVDESYQAQTCTAFRENGNYLSLTNCLDVEDTYGIEPYLEDITEEEVGGDDVAILRKHAWRVVLSCLLSLGVTVGMIYLFKFATACVVWGILCSELILSASLIVWVWYTYWVTGDSYIWRIFVTFFCIIFILLIALLYQKIRLIIQLLKETMKAIFAMHAIIFLPVLTSICKSMIWALLLFSNVFISTEIMAFIAVFNFSMAYWALHFLTGIDYMVIAGAVATWYWSEHKNELDRPIFRSARIVFKFHLGSIAFGSMLISIITFIKAIVSKIDKRCRRLTDKLGFLNSISKNSYIVTAMHGTPFYESGKRAAEIILKNAQNFTSVKFIGSLVLIMTYILICLISMLIHMLLMLGTTEQWDYISYSVVSVVSWFLATTFFSPIETTIDTLLLCFCEDSLLNDGIFRPYAMSRDLMEFVENTKKAYGKKINQAPAEEIVL